MQYVDGRGVSGSVCGSTYIQFSSLYSHFTFLLSCFEYKAFFFMKFVNDLFLDQQGGINHENHSVGSIPGNNISFQIIDLT